MRLLITGASGEVGGPLFRLAREEGGFDAVGTTYSTELPGTEQIDLTDETALRELIKQVGPEVIIHTALSERSPNFETAIPRAGENLARAAAEEGFRLVVLSTDMVFDGEEPPYPVGAAPTASSAYGVAKAEMEERITALHPQAAIVRTSMVYDFNEKNRQISWIVDKVEAGEPLRLFTDEIRQPIWVWDLARVLLELCEDERSGILHVAGPEALNRYDYGLILLDALGLSDRAKVEAVRAAEVAPQRPRDLTMELSEGLETQVRTVSEAVGASRPGDLNNDETMV